MSAGSFQSKEPEPASTRRFTLIQFSAIAMRTRVSARRKPSIGTSSLTSASTSSGVTQTTVFSVRRLNMNVPRRLRKKRFKWS